MLFLCIFFLENRINLSQSEFSDVPLTSQTVVVPIKKYSKKTTFRQLSKQSQPGVVINIDLRSHHKPSSSTLTARGSTLVVRI